MNTRCPPKRVPSAARFFTHCELAVQPPQSYSVGGQRSSGQLTGYFVKAWGLKNALLYTLSKGTSSALPLKRNRLPYSTFK
ncbi:UNVERIFIED_CONTAM: hypothetical protein FKN15_001650 [Acipenser sinensis]